MRLRIALAAALTTIGLFTLPSLAQTPGSLSQRVYHYQAGPTIQTNVPCGSSTTAARVYVDITAHDIGASTRPLTNSVRHNSTLLWEQKSDVALRLNLRADHIATYHQLLLSPGVWRFDASMSGHAASVCSITKR